MQLVPRYLVKNRVNIVADLAGFVVEYRPVYQREIQVYKGIENVIEFRLLNADQKPINTANYTPRFQAFDENYNLVIDKSCDVLDDGSSATKGLFTARITESELLNIKQQFLKYSVYLVNSNQESIITYADSHFGNSGVIRISAEAFPGAKQSKSITEFFREDSESTVYISNTIDAEPGINGNSALHTAVLYTNNYTGTVTLQASLDAQLTDNTAWADIDTVSFNGFETNPVVVNFNGVYNWIRFTSDTDPTGAITKILVRN